MDDMNLDMVTYTTTVWTGSQTCPDEATAACYTNAGAFTFNESFKKGTSIEVCAEPVQNYDIQCSYYETNGKSKQTVSVRVPDLAVEDQPMYSPDTNDFEYPNSGEGNMAGGSWTPYE